ncbi:MAG: hypothetical protein HZB36_06485, partial [Candidatus Omnitrophica bacterium]|nr:hypothetical protein [Candidatus Omnitrophota bacterium]
MAVIAATIFLLSYSDAHAYQVKRIIKGSATLASGVEVSAVTLATGGVDIDMAKAFVLSSVSCDNTTRNDMNVMVVLDDPTTLILSRPTSAVAATVDYYVVEFVSGVSVISGVTTVAETVYTKNITLPGNGVNKATSFPIVSYKMIRTSTTSGAARDEMGIYSAELTQSAGNNWEKLTLSRSDRTSGYNDEIYFQVVTFDTDVTVQSGTTSIAATTTLKTLSAPASFTAVDATKSLLMFTTRPAAAVNGVEEQYAVDGVLTNGSQMDFRRINNTNSVDIVWYLIEFKNEVLAQQGRKAGWTGTTVNVTGAGDTFGTQIFVERAITFVSTSGGTAASNTSPDEIFVRGLLSGASGLSNTLALTRETVQTTIPSNTSWGAAELPLLDVIQPAGGASDTDYSGAAIWQVGGNGAIQWYYSNQMKTGGGGTAGVHRIKIEVSVDGGTNWLQVPNASSLDVDTGTLDNAGSWTWNNIEESIGGTNLLTRYGTAPKSRLKIKITDIEAGIARNFDTSNNYFIVNPTITIDQPPNTWKIGETKNITWSSTGDLTGKTVTIALAVDGTTFDHTIAAGTNAADGTEPWTIPAKTSAGSNTIGTTNKIKITYDDDPLPAYTTVTSTSSAFTLKGQVYNVAPTSAQTWLLGEQHSITWDRKGYFGSGITVGNVDIFYSTNNGLSYEPTPVATAQSAGSDDGSGNGSGSYPWTIPTNLTTAAQAKIKVAKCTHPGPGHPDDSDTLGESATFTVASSLTNNTPDTGDTTIWRYGETHNVAWTPHGNLGTVVIEYKRASQTWVEARAANQYIPGAAPADNLPAGTAEVKQTKSWQVAPPLGYDASGNVEAVTVRVAKTGAEDSVYGDSSPINLKATVSVNPPAPNDIVKVTHGAGGVKKTITWSVNGGASSIPGKVVISLSKDDGGTWFTDLTSNTIDIGSGGNYTWTVDPAHVGTNRVKVSLYGDTDKTNGTSGVSAAFTTIPYLVLTYPNQAGLPAVNVGQELYIKWTPDPTGHPAYFDTVEIKYDTNEGKGANGTPGDADDYLGTVTPAPIDSDNVPGGESEIGYKWTVPDVPGIVGNKMRIKVYQTGKASEVFSVSDYNFTIAGTLSVKGESNGGAYTWKIGETSHYIEWDVVGDLGLVDILYALDGDQPTPTYDHTVATDVSAASGQYQWNPIPNTALDNLDKVANIKFKVQTKDGSISDVSNNTLTIQKKYTSVSVVAPILYVGDQGIDVSNISWLTKGCTSPPTSIKVCLAYDTDSGNNGFTNDIVTCATGTPDVTGYSLWEVPNAIGDKLRVRVKSAAFPGDVYADSADFTINGKILAVYPRATDQAGTDTLVVGDPVASPGIQFTKKGSIGNLKIEYLHYGGGTWNSTVITPEPAGTTEATSLAWAWEQIVATSYNDSLGYSVIDLGGTKNSKLKFTALGAGLPAPIIVETKPFQVRGKIYNVTPTNGQEFLMSSTPTSDYYIKWDTKGNVGNVRVRMDYKGGRGDDNLAGTGDEFAYPVTCTNAECGGQQNAESVPYALGTSGLVWTVPNTETAEAQIRVESIDNHAALADVDMRTYSASTNIRFKGGITNVTPSGAQVPLWKVGQDKSVNWDVVGNVPKVNIVLYYDNDGGPIYDYNTAIYTSDHINPTPKPCPWTIPAGVVTEHAIVTVTSDTDPTTTASSLQEFKIKPVLHLTAPDDNSIPFVVGSQHEIKWDAPVGSAPFLKINISTDAGTTWTDTNPPTLVAKGGLVATDVDSAMAGRTYTWTVPGIMTKQGVIRIYKQGDAESYDDSDSNFYIKGAITDVYAKVNQGDPDPQNPIDLPAGTDRYITWKFKGTMGSVDIYYTTNGDALPSPTWQLCKDSLGQDAVGIPIVGGNGSGSFLWRIPSTPSSKVQVKVVNTPDVRWPDVTGISSGYNSIVGSISEVQVVSDANGTILEVSGSKTLKWKPMGGVTSFDIEYKHDSSVWFNIASGVSGTPDGDYRTWPWNNIPALDGNAQNIISDNVHFRILDHDNPTKTSAESASAYILKGKLNLLIPDDGSQTWTLGTDYNQDNVKGGRIKWNKQGNIGNLKILFSSSGTFGADTLTIAASQGSGSDGDNEIIWSAGVVGANRRVSDTCRVKVIAMEGVQDLELIDQSTQEFKIRPSISSILSPANGALWNVTSPATSKDIRWNANSGYKADGVSWPKVIVAYSVGGSYTTFTGGDNLDCQDGDNVFSVNVPNEKYASATVKVSFVDYPNDVNLVSNTFKIYPLMLVSEPLTTSTIEVGSNNANFIKWSLNGSTKVQQVNIYYDLDGGSGGYPVLQKI